MISISKSHGSRHEFVEWTNKWVNEEKVKVMNDGWRGSCRRRCRSDFECLFLEGLSHGGTGSWENQLEMAWVGKEIVFFTDFLFFFRLCYAARGILIPPPGIELRPPALEAQSLNHWTTRKVPQMLSSILLSSCDIVMYNKYILVFVPTSGI